MLEKLTDLEIHEFTNILHTKSSTGDKTVGNEFQKIRFNKFAVLHNE